MVALLPTIRLASLGSVTVFSLIVLGLAGHVTNTTTTNAGVYFTFAALSIATAVLSMISLPVMIVVDNVRKGAFTSMIVVELAWLGVLWILWLSSAATASQADSLVFGAGCNYRNKLVKLACNEFAAVQAFAFLNWIILMGYSIVLLTYTLIAAQRGHSVWTSSVKETDFNAPHVAGAPQQVQTDKPQEYIPTQHSGIPQAGYPSPSVTPQAYPPTNMATPGWAGQPQVHSPAQSAYPQV